MVSHQGEPAAGPWQVVPARIAVGETTPADRRAWMAEEEPFLLDGRAWERASVIVAGTPELPHDPEAEAVAANSPV